MIACEEPTPLASLDPLPMKEGVRLGEDIRPFRSASPFLDREGGRGVRLPSVPPLFNGVSTYVQRCYPGVTPAPRQCYGKAAVGPPSRNHGGCSECRTRNIASLAWFMQNEKHTPQYYGYPAQTLRLYG